MFSVSSPAVVDLTIIYQTVFMFFRYHVPAERFVPIVSPDDGYDGHYDRCDDAYSSRKEAAALYSRASAIVDAMPSSAAALSRAYATATMRPSNRCCTGPMYSGGGSSGGGGCGYQQYGTVGRSRSRSPRDPSPSGMVRPQAAHLSSTGSPPKGQQLPPPSNGNAQCLLQYDSHAASTLPRCGSASVIWAGQNQYGGGGHDEPSSTGYGGGHPVSRRISSSCIRESTALACCSTAAYSGHGVKNGGAPATLASVATSAATTPPVAATGHTSSNGSYISGQSAHCPPAQPNNASW